MYQRGGRGGGRSWRQGGDRNPNFGSQGYRQSKGYRDESFAGSSHEYERGRHSQGYKQSKGYRDESPAGSSREHERVRHSQGYRHSKGYRDESSAGSSHEYERGHRSRGGRPRGLRGKEIGMYYATLNRLKKDEEDAKAINKLSVRLDACRQEQIWKLLSMPDDNKQGISTNRQSTNSESQRLQGIAGSSSSSDTKDIDNKYSHIQDSVFKRRFLHNLTANQRATLGASEVVRNALERDPELDQTLKNELEGKRNHNTDYISMQTNRARLPAYSNKENILKLLSENQVVVISGETGCGKTTQVAQFILDAAIEQGNGSLCRIVCTQPRRISAISVAQRVADERCEPVGARNSVGYQIRLECRLPRERGSILYCTTGVLIQWLQSDPCLERVSHLIVDEIHERDTLSDFVLTIMKDLLPHRPDMKLLLMSATLNAKTFSHYYNNCPMLTIPGLTFPVKVHYLEDVLQMTGYRFSGKNCKQTPKWKKHTSLGKEEHRLQIEYQELMEPFIRDMKRKGLYSQHVLDSLMYPQVEEMNLELIAALVKYICNQQDHGAILVFLPGWDQISKLYNQLVDNSFFSSSRYRILPLHSAMPTVNQKEIFIRPPHGVRKIVIATNIAETSITIDDVVYVVDCGKIKMKNFDVERNLQTLKAEWVSLANAIQRRGRAGRVQAGVCYHLFTKPREMLLQQYPLPEMLRSRLEEVILQLKILQLGMVRPFLEKVMDPPDPRAVDHSIKLLETLNALDNEERLTPLGFHLAQLPMDPQIGKMILMGALFRCLDPVLSVAASLSHKDAFTLPLGSEKMVNERKEELSLGLKSDHLVFAEAMRRWEQAELLNEGRNFCWEYFLSSNTLVFLRNMKVQFAEHLKEMNFISTTTPKDEDFNINSSNRSLVKAIVCAGLYPNVAVVKKVKKKRKPGISHIVLVTPEDGRVELHPRSINSRQKEFESPLLLYHLKLRSSKIYLHDATMVHPLPLLFFGGGLHSVTDEHGNSLLQMDTLQFACKKDTAILIKELRKRLDQLLEHKVSHPQIVDWETASPERALLQAIVELITTEDKHHMLVPDHCSDGDSD